MKRIKEHRYMYRRGEMLLFRRGIPERYRPYFDGRVEVQKSLDTNVIAEARHRLPIELAKFEAMIARAKREERSSSATQAIRTPTIAEIEEGVRAWLSERMSRADPGDVTNPENVAAALRNLEDLAALSAVVAASNKVGSGGANPANRVDRRGANRTKSLADHAEH